MFLPAHWRHSKASSDFAIVNTICSLNPAAELTIPAYENRLAERILAEGDVLQMLAAESNPRDRILLRLLYGAGLRVSEACSLLWRNLHARGEAGQITIFG